MEKVKHCWVRAVTHICHITINKSISKIKVYFQSIPLTFNILWLCKLKIAFNFKNLHLFNRPISKDQQLWGPNFLTTRPDLKEITLSLCSPALVFFHHQASIQPFHHKCRLCSSHLSTFSHSKWWIKCHKVQLTIISSTQSINNLNTFNICNLKICLVSLIMFIKSICFNLIAFRMKSYFISNN